jgi:maintenance of mitochondrial morphology protein 1
MNALTAFFLGQLSLALLIFCFIKYFIFGEPPPTNAANATKRRGSSGLLHTPRLRRKRSTLLRPEPPVQPSTILSKTFYNVSGHLPESLDWFNVLLAQTLAQLRTEALHDDALLKSLAEVLNGSVKPDFVGPITITELALGEEFPIFSNCRIIPVDEGGVEVKSVGESTRLLARLDVDLSDAITLGVETKLMLNYPVPLVAVLPVALAVSVVRFSGTVSKMKLTRSRW